mgnify:CR=1 FL=1
MKYEEFLAAKIHSGSDGGFEPLWLPDFLFDFQRALVEWSLRKGRAALFADCGLGKTPMQLVWAENVARKTEGNVLIVTPLAVGYQTVREGEKFGIECVRSTMGAVTGRITVTNYERLHLFSADDFAGVVCDESSILKNFDGKRRAIITEFLRTRPYRLLCTATAAPNDYIELGTASEALGMLGYTDMLTRFFKNDQNTVARNRFYGEQAKWRFKHHGEQPFWRWVCSWARSLRRPSDLGFLDDGFALPNLIEREIVLESEHRFDGELFARTAIGLSEQRKERRATIQRRCEEVAARVSGDECAVSWCHLNDEGDLLEKIIPGAVQVSGSDSDECKEEVFLAFSLGQIRVLVTKPRIGAFGLNWQHCPHMTFFPSHSYEQYYQGVRRCWRFGQVRPVTVDIIATDGERGVLKNLQRKALAADKMFSELVAHMDDALHLKRDGVSTKEELPTWL